ncbi:MAG: hypothetical protein ACRCWQ_14245 [Bacilli bacterium]
MSKTKKIILGAVIAFVVLIGVGGVFVSKWASDNFDVYSIDVAKEDVQDVLEIVADVIDYGFSEEDVNYVLDKISAIKNAKEQEVGMFDIKTTEETMLSVDALISGDVTTLTFVSGKSVIAAIGTAMDEVFDTVS